MPIAESSRFKTLCRFFSASARVLTASIAVAVLSGADAPSTPLKTEHLTCEYLTDPIGLDETTPRLAWTLASDGRGVMQSAYQIEVASTRPLLTGDHADLWDPGKIASAETNQIEYRGKPLVSREQCFWRVRSWDQNDKMGPWSEPAKFEIGLLSPAEWQSKWISGMAPRTGGNIEIESASYQTVDGKISKDVADIVRSKIHDGMLDLTVNNQVLGGDPAENKQKQLKISYVADGKLEQKTLAEKASLNLPSRSLAQLRKTFHVGPSVARARLYATGFGLYDVQINGSRVGNHVLAPDWTDYKKRVRYQVYDVTDQLKAGDNSIDATLADGWYAGHIGNGGYRFWGDHPLFTAQLEITYDDDTIARVVTGDSWKAHASPILASDFMLGEDYDARNEIQPGTEISAGHGWGPVTIESPKVPEIDAQVSPPVTELMTRLPKSMSEPMPGHWLFDLGQNMVGVARIKTIAPAGTKITIRFAEMLNKDGTIYTANYRGAPSIDHYTCKGGGTEIWQPTFTFHGFRYVEVTGLPADPSLDTVTGIVLGSATPQTGQFTCSDPRINQLQSNIQWGQRGNFLSVPTDCPQRDERLGWMGDAEVFVGTAVYNADVSAFFSKWLIDVDDAQTADGQFTNVSPDTGAGAGTPAWADAGVICPWTVYRTYGDVRELRRHLPNMIRWVEYCRNHSDHLIRTKKDLGSNFGDWLSIKAATPGDLLGTAYFAHSVDLVAKASKVCGNDEDARRYADLFQQIRTAFDDKFVDKEGGMTGGTQTDYALALQFNLVPDSLRTRIAQRLADDVKAKGDHLSTGFVGVSYLLPALCGNGHQEASFNLLMQDTFPSWLFSVSHGATTIWERWDGWTPEKGFQDAGMNSFNHYSLGSCGQWLYESVAGISQPGDGDSFKKLIIHPHLGGGLTRATGRYASVRGAVFSEWSIEDEKIVVTVTIPPNTTATVYVPTPEPTRVSESGKRAADATGVKMLKPEADAAVFEIGSGTYVFTAAGPKGS